MKHPTALTVTLKPGPICKSKHIGSNTWNSLGSASPCLPRPKEAREPLKDSVSLAASQPRERHAGLLACRRAASRRSALPLAAASCVGLRSAVGGCFGACGLAAASGPLARFFLALALFPVASVFARPLALPRFSRLALSRRGVPWSVVALDPHTAGHETFDITVEWVLYANIVFLQLV